MRLFHVDFSDGPYAGQKGYQVVTSWGIASIHLLDGTNVNDDPGGTTNTGEVAEADLPQWFIKVRDGEGLPPLPPVYVPQEVTKLQLYKAANQIGKWDLIWAALSANPEAKLIWDLATAVQRDDPTLNALAQQAGWTDEEVDGLFILAGSQV